VGGESNVREVREGLKRFVRQNIETVHIGFLAVVEEYLGPVINSYGRGETVGALKARANIRPKQKRVLHDGEEHELKKIWNVPVSWYKMGDFIVRFPLKKGDVVMCLVSERALDHLIVDHDPAHPQLKDFARINDAVIMPFGVRMDEDPHTPDEVLDGIYFALVDDDNAPISKFMMKADGEVKIVAPKFTVISPDINMVDHDGPQVSRVGDKDDDAGCSGNGPNDKLIEGSPSMKVADESTYTPGAITEPRFTGGG